MKKLIFLLVLLFVLPCIAEEEEEPVQLYVTATVLNGRSSPNKKAKIEARFDKDDIVTATGKWSRDYKWIEVYGGETGTVWCSITYLAENAEPVLFINPEKNRTVKIRKNPVKGRVTTYLKGKQKVKITQIVNGWGKCSKGWIDLSYLEVADDE